MKIRLWQCLECRRVFTSNKINPICPACDDRNQWPEVAKICDILTEMDDTKERVE